MSIKNINILLLSIYIILFIIFVIFKMYLYCIISIHFILLVISMLMSSYYKNDINISKSKKTSVSHIKLG